MSQHWHRDDKDDKEASEPLTPPDPWTTSPTPKPFFSLNNMNFASQSSIHNSQRQSSRAPRTAPINRSVASMAHAVTASFTNSQRASVSRYQSSPIESLVEDMHCGDMAPSAPDISLMNQNPPKTKYTPTTRHASSNYLSSQTYDKSQSCGLDSSIPTKSPVTARTLKRDNLAAPTSAYTDRLQKSTTAAPTVFSARDLVFSNRDSVSQLTSPSLSQLTSPSFSTHSDVSQLHGLHIQPSYDSGNGTPVSRDDRRVSFDLEANQSSVPRGDMTASSLQTVSLSGEQMNRPSQPSAMSRVMSQLQWRVWMRRMNREINNVANVTTGELRHISQTIASTAIRACGLSTALQNWNDLKYFEELHKEKMGHIRQAHSEEHYDFALVLTAQEVYAFWTDHLDFRFEYLGDDTKADTEPCESEINWRQPFEDLSNTIDSRPLVTPLIGIRNRRGRTSPESRMTMEIPSEKKLQEPNTAPVMSSRSGFSHGGSSRPMLKKRLSLFDRAVNPFSPERRMSSSLRATKVHNEDQPMNQSFESLRKATPSMSSARRRRWGNRRLSDGLGSSTPDLFSPPVRSLKRASSSVRKTIATDTSGRGSTLTADEPTSGKRRRKNNNSLIIEEIPTQLVPRGIAARTSGMERFLSALKRGIVLRRHRPNAEAVFCRLISEDGGDTIRYEYIDTEEALIAFKEQRVRYNRNLASKGSPSFVRSISKRWSYKETNGDDEQIQTFSLPDFIAAKQYRQQQIAKQGGIKKKVVDLATQVSNSGSTMAKHLIAVHPARHEDPRSEMAELGTSTFRRSKSEFHAPHSFSLVTSRRGFIHGKQSTKASSYKWHSGEGKDGSFNYLDFEAATEGEYWLIFRGFLLLHRDAASGRFAQQRAAGFGSNYNHRDQEPTSEEDSSNAMALGGCLPKDQFYEPPTVGWFEYCVAKNCTSDTSYMVGHAVEGAKPPPSDYFLGFRSPGTQIWSRLRQAGFDTKRIYAIDRRTVMIKVQCPSDRLTDVGEVLRLKLKTKEGSFAPFRENATALFRPCDEPWSPYHDDGASLFRSSERQAIIDFIIRSRIRDSGAELGQNTDLGKMVDRRVPLHMHERLDILYHAWVHFWRKHNWRGRDGRSLTDGSEKTKEFSSCNKSEAELSSVGNASEPEIPNFCYRLLKGCLHQPLDSVEQYFGEKVAFYFVWLQHCSNHLIVLSVMGYILFIFQLASGRFDHPLRPFFSVFVMIWSFVVMINWRKRSNFLSYRWGTMDVTEQETTRPQFKGEYRRDEITGEWVVYYPTWKRWLKYSISFPLTVAFTIGTLMVILLVHANRDLMLARYYEQQTNPHSQEFQYTFSASAIGKRAPINAVELNREVLTDPTFWIIVAGFPAALGLCLPLLNLVLMRISVMLNDFENYRTESEYRTMLIIKVFSFRFVCYFAALYYYAYISAGSDEAIENGILRVGTGVFVYMTVAHWWTIFLSVYFPILMFRIRKYRQKMNLLAELREVELQEYLVSDANDESPDVQEKKKELVNKRILLEQAQSDIWDEVMLREHDSFPEYIQAVVQFAYVTCFSVVLPIAPLICLINHLCSMRLDAYKLCRGRRRPLVQKTGGIGVWEHVLHIVTVIAVLTNCFLMGFTSYLFRNLGEAVGSLALFCIVVGWEHIMLLIKYVMQTTISPFPKTVRDEMKREQYKVARQRNSTMNEKKRSRRSKRGKSNARRRDSDDTSLASSQLQQLGSFQDSVSFDERSMRSARSASAGNESELSARSNGSDEENQYLPASLQKRNQPWSTRRMQSSLQRDAKFKQSKSALKSVQEPNPTPQAPTPCKLHLDAEVSNLMESPFEIYMAAEKTPDSKEEVTEGRVSDVLETFLQQGDTPFFDDLEKGTHARKRHGYQS